MSRDAQALAASLAAATDAGFRGRLLARGQAQSMIRRNGVLPDDAPAFSAFLDADLLNYGYALLANGLDLLEELEAEGDSETNSQAEVARLAFIQSSYALEAATRNSMDAPDTTLHRLIAGAASHLGGYAARAFSLMEGSRESGQLTPMELTLADLAMRSLNSIEERTRLLRSSVEASDESLLASISGDGNQLADDGAVDALGPVVMLLTENYLSAVSTALFAIEVQDQDLLATALQDLALGERASLDVSAPGPWWVHRLTRRLLDD